MEYDNMHYKIWLRLSFVLCLVDDLQNKDLPCKRKYVLIYIMFEQVIYKVLNI